MSEFECAEGHLMSPSDQVCKICGGRAVRMDGLTAHQWQQMEEVDRKLDAYRAEQEYLKETEKEEQ